MSKEIEALKKEQEERVQELKEAIRRESRAKWKALVQVVGFANGEMLRQEREIKELKEKLDNLDVVLTHSKKWCDNRDEEIARLKESRLTEQEIVKVVSMASFFIEDNPEHLRCINLIAKALLSAQEKKEDQ